MSRIYWDTMLFIYWFENTEPYADQVARIYARMTARGDQLVTSMFTLGEVLVGPLKTEDQALHDRYSAWLTGRRVELLPFDEAVIRKYSMLRAKHRVRTADALHLAAAACAKVDLFLTHDRELRRLAIEGIDFIDGLDTTALGTD